MGQSASKVANRVVGSILTSSTSGTVVRPKHIPSIPGKTSADAAALGITSTVIVDPITGFTRGTAPLTPSEERQRQFLESRQTEFQTQQQQRQPDDFVKHRNGSVHHSGNDRTVSTTTTTATSQERQAPPPPPGTDTKMPEDLLNFLKDMGPVIRSPSTTPLTDDPKRRVPRIARMLPSSVDSPMERDHDQVHDGTSRPELKPGYDKTRITTNMPLATNIPGYETSRTTSFSTKLDVHDPNEIPGYTIVQLYGLLAEHFNNPTTTTGSTSDGITKSASSASTTDDTTKSYSTTKEEEDQQQRQQHEQLLQNAYQYIQVPVLLKDSDGSYIGAHPAHVSSLLGAHRGMKRLDTQTQAKLILQELYEQNLVTVNANTAASNATIPESITGTSTGPTQNVVVASHLDLGPSKAASAST